MYRSFPSSRRIRICAIRTRAPTARRASTRSDFSADPTTIASVRATGKAKTVLDTGRPLRLPRLHPALVYVSFSIQKEKKIFLLLYFCLFFLPLVFLSIRFDSSRGHQAAAARLGHLWWQIIQKNRKRKGAQRTSGIPQMTW
jgi:hypothetical protein